MKRTREYIDIISFDWESAEIGICHGDFGNVAAEFSAACGQDAIEVSGTEAAGITRLKASGLKPDRDYRVTVRYPGGEKALDFKTLPLPCGICSGSYAVIADPHISSKPENRKGRLFVESAQILHAIIEQCNALNVDFILIAGDLTNNAGPEEFALLEQILAAAECPLICAPGDHDVIPDGLLWQRFAADKRLMDFADNIFNVKAIDTSGNVLPDADAARLETMLGDARIPLILTHVQLLPNPALKFGAKAGQVGNYPDYRELFGRFALRDSVIYAGHQNIPARIAYGGLCQVHLPQPCQFPCSWYHVRAFDNGLYHKSMPIASEILRQRSRIDSQLAAEFFGEPQWRTDYRRGENPGAGNFLIPLNLKRNLK